VITLERDPTRAIGVRPAVSAVIFDRRGRLLLQQRSDGGQWGLPGGSVEIGESVLDAVAREVHERPADRQGATADRRVLGAGAAARSLSGRECLALREPVVRVHGARGALQTCDETLALEYFPLRRLPPTLLGHHRVRIRDATSRRVAPFIR